MMNKFIQLLSFAIFITIMFSCNRNVIVGNQNLSIEKVVSGEIIRDQVDTTHVSLLIHNNTDKSVNVPNFFDTGLSTITFTTPSGHLSKCKLCCGTSCPYIVLPATESHAYEIPNTEHFMLLLGSSIEREEVGWFTLHWTNERFNIKESISIYFDYETARRNLDK